MGSGQKFYMNGREMSFIKTMGELIEYRLIKGNPEYKMLFINEKGVMCLIYNNPLVQTFLKQKQIKYFFVKTVHYSGFWAKDVLELHDHGYEKFSFDLTKKGDKFVAFYDKTDIHMKPYVEFILTKMSVIGDQPSFNLSGSEELESWIKEAEKEVTEASKKIADERKLEEENRIKAHTADIEVNYVKYINSLESDNKKQQDQINDLKTQIDWLTRRLDSLTEVVNNNAHALNTNTVFDIISHK